MTTRRNAFRFRTSFTLMAASRTSAALGTGCEGRVNIGRDETGLTRGQRWPHLKDTRKLVVFHGRCRCVTNVSEKQLDHDRSRAAVMRLMLVLPRMFPHLDFENDEKYTVERENKVKLIEHLVSDQILAQLESVPLSAPLSAVTAVRRLM
jgi:hypothetical protein